MAMRCPNCGNEIGPGETFCGQCGMPNIPPAQPTEMNSQFTHNEMLSSSYNPNISSPSNVHNSGVLPPSSPSHTFYGGMPSTPTGPLYPNQPIIGPSGPQHQVGFYRDATEALSFPAKDSQNFQMGYLRQSQVFVGMPAPAGYQGANQYNPQMQSFQTSNYAGSATAYPQARPSLNGQSYRGQPPLPPQKKQSNTILIIVCICLAIALIMVAAFGAIYLLHNNSSKAHNKTASRPTSAVMTTTAPAPSPTLSPTAASTPSPTPSLTPSVDPGFTHCASECTSNGFVVEYPSGWTEAGSQDSNGFGGEQFSNSSTNNPSAIDEFANFKSSMTTSNPPEALLAADFNVNFANKPGYTAPSSTSDAWIDGAKWSNEMASYQLNNQTEHVEVFAIVFQQRSYIIELQAPDSLFNQINTQYFEFMLGRFQFQQSAP